MSVYSASVLRCLSLRKDCPAKSLKASQVLSWLCFISAAYSDSCCQYCCDLLAHLQRLGHLDHLHSMDLLSFASVKSSSPATYIAEMLNNAKQYGSVTGLESHLPVIGHQTCRARTTVNTGTCQARHLLAHARARLLMCMVTHTVALCGPRLNICGRYWLRWKGQRRLTIDLSLNVGDLGVDCR